ncbi:hypothetical protein RCL_jg2165.t1 [Rhizophagus clarus]|uniref:Uncharacterized protein n=1 Tax=Rhizophagus clarus TaxID=94130 RepID=A0A8H3KS67_9GLOM|nr:hypothetical protein RCL_jg2165.t1 [Rhizophagus clarus]
MTETHHQAYLEWTLAHRNWTTRKWRRVWHEPEEELNPDCVAVIVKHSPSRMFWCCFSWRGLGPIHFPRGDRIFQEDNALPHYSKVAIAARNDAKIVVLQWQHKALT